MTFLEAALDVLRREKKPLHFKEITRLAIKYDLLSVVGRDPESMMQTRLQAEVRRPGSPVRRVIPGVFGLSDHSPESAAQHIKKNATVEIKSIPDGAAQIKHPSASTSGLHKAPSRILIFILHHQRDRAWEERLRIHLRMLERNGGIECVSMRDAPPGDDWIRFTEEKIEQAQIVLVLISADMLADTSTQIFDKLSNTIRLGKQVIPIILKMSAWQETVLANLPHLPRDGKALAGRSKARQDTALAEIAQAVGKMAREFNSGPFMSIPSPPDLSQSQAKLISQDRSLVASVGNTKIFVCRTSEPWLLAVDALVVPSGSRGNLTGGLINKFIKLTNMNDLSDRLQAKLAPRKGVLRPGSPILLDVPETVRQTFGIPKYLIAATAFEDSLASSEFAGRAARAVLALAEKHTISRIALPLLGSGDGGLSAEDVAVAILRSIWKAKRKFDPMEVTLTTLDDISADALVDFKTRLPRDIRIEPISKPGSAQTLELSDPRTVQPGLTVRSRKKGPKARPQKTEELPPSSDKESEPLSNSSEAKSKSVSDLATRSEELWLKIRGNTRELRRGTEVVWITDNPPFDWQARKFGLAEDLSLVRAKDRLRDWGTDEVCRFGGQLAALLWGPSVPQAVLDSLQIPIGESRRLVLDLDGDAAAVPWEYLRVAGGFLLERRLSIVRHVATLAKPGPAPITIAKPRALLLAFSTVGDPYPVKEHQWQIKDALSHIGLAVEALPHCRSKDLQDELGSNRYDGFHFLGHGQQGSLLVHGQGESEERVSGIDLSNWLGRSKRVGWVFMGACHSGAAPLGVEDFSGVALTLTRELGLPVVAMQVAVPQDFSTAFAVQFYKELQRSGFNLEQSVYEARKFEHDQRCAFGIPVLVADFENAPRVLDLSEPPKAEFISVVNLVSPKEWDSVSVPMELRETLREALKNAPIQARVPAPDPEAPAEALRNLLRWLREDNNRPQAEEEERRIAASYAAPLSPTSIIQELPIGEPVVRLDRDFIFEDWSVVAGEYFSRLREKYSFDRDLVPQVIAELAAGRHIMFTGPVGTGKTSLAREISTALGYSPHIVTASADWTNHEVVGGHFPQTAPGGGIDFVFRPGAFVEAVMANWRVEPAGDGQALWTRAGGTWLIIDEFNRADMDRALGGLLTALETRRLRVPTTRYMPGGAASLEIPIPSDFRVLCTLNTVDRHYLFRMSDALKRRFAFIEVPAAEDWSDEWNRLSEVRGDADPALCGDLRRAVYLIRLLHDLGTAHLRAALSFLRAAEASPLSPEARLSHAIAGSLLPALEDADPAVLDLLVAWSTGIQELEDALGRVQAAADETRKAHLQRCLARLSLNGLINLNDSQPPYTITQYLSRQAVTSELSLRNRIVRMVANVR